MIIVPQVKSNVKNVISNKNMIVISGLDNSLHAETLLEH